MSNAELRENDAQIGQALFGWRWWTCRWSETEASWFLLPPRPEGRLEHWTPGRIEGGVLAADWDRDLPRYSRDLGAAWEVVEAFRRRWREKGNGWFWRIEDQTDGWWIAIVNGLSESKMAVVVSDEGDTLPLAVCRAALALMEGEGDG